VSDKGLDDTQREVDMERTQKARQAIHKWLPTEDDAPQWKVNKAARESWNELKGKDALPPKYTFSQWRTRVRTAYSSAHPKIKTD
jgi:hypothetical protein